MTFKEHISDIDGLITNTKMNFYLYSFQFQHKAYAMPEIRSIFNKKNSFKEYMNTTIFLSFPRPYQFAKLARLKTIKYLT